MRKFLLTFAAFAVAFTAFAQTQFGSFEPVSVPYELNNVKTTVAGDGSVYVSSTYDQAFAFAGGEVAAPNFTSPCIVKYSATGAEQWAVTFSGIAEIFDIVADADGTLYAAGHFAAEVVCTGANGTETVISGDASTYSALIVKISAAGEVEAVKTIATKVNDEIASKVGDPWGEGVDSPLYSMWDPIYVTPNKIQIEGDKVYVSVKYMGDVTELGWRGSYIDMFGMMYSDNYANGVFSLSKETLDNVASVANVLMTGVVSEAQYYAEAFNFTVNNGVVYVGFIGFGNLTLTTADAEINYEFDMDGMGTNEHAFVLATIGAETVSKEFRVAGNDRFYIPFSLFMENVGEDIVIAGTYYGQFPFNTNIVTEEATALFVAKLAQDGTVKDAASFAQVYTPAVCMGATETAVIISADEATYTYAAGAVETSNASYSDIYANSIFVHTNETKVCVDSANFCPTGIEEIVTENNSGVAYNLFGQPVDENYKGIVVKNGKKYIVK